MLASRRRMPCARLSRFFVLATLVSCARCASGVPSVGRDAGADLSLRTDAPSLDEDASAPAYEDVFFAPRDSGGEDALVEASVARRGPPYPIVLHHGFAGFRDIGPVNYYFGVARDLRARGVSVHEAEVTPFDAPSVRAAQLARFVDRVRDETNRQKVIVIAHSQGGLDARFMISSLGYGDRVAALVTISTPHRGTRVADTVLGFVPGATDAFVNAIASAFAWTYNEARARNDLRAALVGLSEREAATFNAANPDDPRVLYWSWAGRSHLRTGVAVCNGARYENEPLRVDPTTLPLAPFAALLEGFDPLENVNDGLVSVRSARWGVFQGCVPADHFDEVGQIAHTGPIASGFDHLAFYRKIVDDLRAAGL
jgi:triacylglycerol lipase